MKKRKILNFVIIFLFGVFMIVYGEYDDSQGGQLLGVLAAVIGIIGYVRTNKIKS